MTSQVGQRALSPGRVIIVSNETHQNSLAIILQQSSMGQKTSLSKDPLDKLFTVLVLVNQGNQNSVKADEMKLTAEDKITEPFITRKLANFDGSCTQNVEEIRASDIAFISAKQIKTEPSKIIDDHKKREISRFRFEIL